MMDELIKPDLDDFNSRNLEEYADRLWQQRVKTERASAESDDDTGNYSPTRESYYYDAYYGGETDAFRESLDCSQQKRSWEDSSPSGSSVAPAKRPRGRPYREACVKITCLRPEDRLSTTLMVDFNKLQEEELGVPKSELIGGLRSSSKLPLTWSSEDLRKHILRLFPRVQTFSYMRCTQGKTLDPLPDDIRPADLRILLGRSGLYIVPHGNLLPKGTTSTEPSTPPDQTSVSTTSHASNSSSSSSNNSNTSSSLSSNNQHAESSTSNKHYWEPTKVHGEKVENRDDQFRVSLDMSDFSPAEITLKTKSYMVVVHAKHDERTDEHGMVEREFKRLYVLPKDVDPNEVTSSLSASGTLTLKAPKMSKDNLQERIIPIHFSSEDS